jgi:hypothetical protein
MECDEKRKPGLIKTEEEICSGHRWVWFQSLPFLSSLQEEVDALSERWRTMSGKLEIVKADRRIRAGYLSEAWGPFLVGGFTSLRIGKGSNFRGILRSINRCSRRLVKACVFLMFVGSRALAENSSKAEKLRLRADQLEAGRGSLFWEREEMPILRKEMARDRVVFCCNL